MREIPVLLQGWEVRAILDGHKRMLRVPLKPQPIFYPDGGCWYPWAENPNALHYANEKHFRKGFVQDFSKIRPGDLLWGRETWQKHKSTVFMNGTSPVAYRATDADSTGKRGPYGDRWRPSIHMPKWACRLWLPVEEVRVERLQEISEEDAILEGVEPVEWVEDYGGGVVDCTSFQRGFEDAWNRIHTAPGTTWDDNPRVIAALFDDPVEHCPECSTVIIGECPACGREHGRVM